MAGKPTGRKKAALRPLPEDRDLFTFFHLSRRPAKERRLVEEIVRTVEELEDADKKARAIAVSSAP